MPTQTETMTFNKLRLAIAAAQEETEVNPIAVSDTSKELVASRRFRSSLIVHNAGGATAYLRWGEEGVDVDGNGYSFRLQPNATMTLEEQHFWEITKEPLHAACANGNSTVLTVTQKQLILPPSAKSAYRRASRLT